MASKKNKNDYFLMAEQQVQFCVESAALLHEILSNYSPDHLPEMQKKMHEIEHKADELHHDILRKLSAEFITPIDQEDILQLVKIIDDVTDALDEVVLYLYMFCIDTLPEDALALSAKINQCVNALGDAVKELKNFKKSSELHNHIVKVNDIESDADEIYVEAIHKLFRTENDGKVLLGSRAIYDSLENCCDLCEHATDCIEQIILKNT